MEESITIDSIKFLFENSDLPDTVQNFKSNGGIEPFIRAFESDLQHGIHEIELDSHFTQRREKWGTNNLSIPPKKSFFSFFFESFEPLPTRIFLLTIALWFIITFVFPPNGITEFSNFIEFISALIGIIIISSIHAAIKYFQQNRFIEMLKLNLEYNVSLIRYGKSVQVKNSEILVGDIVQIKRGDVAPADGIFFDGSDLKIKIPNQTESSIISVSEDNPFIVAGSSVISGKGKMLVCAVGENSTSFSPAQIREKSSFETKIHSLSNLMTYFGFFSSLLIFAVLAVFWCIEAFKQREETGKLDPKLLIDLVSRLVISITIFLCCSPDCYSNVLERCYGFLLKHILLDHIIAPTANSLASMSYATTLCIHKNGMIVNNRTMKLEKIYVSNETYDDKLQMPETIKNLLSKSISLNTNASLMFRNISEAPQLIGPPLECALLNSLSNNHIDYSEIRKINAVVYSMDFDNKDKLMYSIANQNDSDHYACYVKGSPESVLPYCNRYIDNTGTIQELNESNVGEFENINLTFSNSGLSTLLIAYKEIETNVEFSNLSLIQSNLIIIGILGISNPLFEDNKKLIEELSNAHIVLRLLTNENSDLSKTIAKSAGILSDDSIPFNSDDFEDVQNADLLDYISQVTALSHASSEDKLKFVSLLQESGDVVALVGDTTDDCLLMKKSDASISMESQNNEILKMNSDLSINQDGLHSIVNAFKWGRGIYDNIQCYIQYQLIANITAVILTLIGSCLFKMSPFQIVSLIWIYLIIDKLSGIALLTKTPIRKLFERIPNSPTEFILSRQMLRNIIGHVVYQIVVFVIIILLSKSVLDIQINEEPKRISSIMFNTYVFCQIFNLFNSRSVNDDVSIWTGLFSNPLFFVIVFIILVLQCLFMIFCQSSFSITRLGVIDWAISIVFGVLVLLIGLALRCFKISNHTEKFGDNKDQ